MNSRGAAFSHGLAAFCGGRKPGVISFKDHLNPMSIPETPMPTLLTESVMLEPDRVRILDRRVFPFQ